MRLIKQLTSKVAYAFSAKKGEITHIVCLKKKRCIHGPLKAGHYIHLHIVSFCSQDRIPFTCREHLEKMNKLASGSHICIPALRQTLLPKALCAGACGRKLRYFRNTD